MFLRWLFILEAVFSVVTGAALLIATDWTLDVYGLETDAVGRFMTQTAAGLYIGVGLTSWLVRNLTEPRLTLPVTTAFSVYHVVLLIVAAFAWLGSGFDFELGWVSVLVEAAFALAFGAVTLRARAAGSR